MVSEFEYQITKHEPISLLQSPTDLFVCTDKEIKKIKITELEQYIKKYKHQESKQEIPCKIFREENGISTVILLAENKS